MILLVNNKHKTMNNQSTAYAYNVDDYLNTTIIFGEVKKTIISKNFLGGKVHNLFGSTQLDFTYADISGVVVLDVSQAFGETKIRVPQNWRVETDVTHFCSITEDKRRDLTQSWNSGKVLVITGISGFAVVEVTGSL
jgi:predicted membrane protein